MKNIIICGVGGQGVILASKIIIEVAMQAGFDVKESEVHGMAQRGGSVDCQVRYGEKVYSPLIDKGKADHSAQCNGCHVSLFLRYIRLRHANHCAV